MTLSQTLPLLHRPALINCFDGCGVDAPHCRKVSRNALDGARFGIGWPIKRNEDQRQYAYQYHKPDKAQKSDDVACHEDVSFCVLAA